MRSLASAIAASNAADSEREKAKDAWARYEATWPREEANPDEAGQHTEGHFRLRGKSFFFTYNWDFFNKPTPDGTAPAASPNELWKRWKSWKASKKVDLPWNSRWTARWRAECTSIGRST